MAKKNDRHVMRLALELISDYPAGANSDPDVMAEAIEDMQHMAALALEYGGKTGRRKSIAYAYPSSEVAARLNRPHGAWYIKIWTEGEPPEPYQDLGWDEPDAPSLKTTFWLVDADVDRSFEMYGNIRALVSLGYYRECQNAVAKGPECGQPAAWVAMGVANGQGRKAFCAECRRVMESGAVREWVAI